MILSYNETDSSIEMFVSVKKRPKFEEYLQEVIYRPTLEMWENFHKYILRLKPFQKWKEKLKKEYFISYASEYSHYYIDCYDSDIYRILWKKLNYNPLTIPVGTTLYHLTPSKNVVSILKDGLFPSRYSKDNVYYGANKVFFSTKPILDENEVDPHLYNRVQLEVIYDGSYKLYVDQEYNSVSFNGHNMVYTLTDNPIPVKCVSDIQPKRKVYKKAI